MPRCVSFHINTIDNDDNNNNNNNNNNNKIHVNTLSIVILHPSALQRLTLLSAPWTLAQDPNLGHVTH